MGKRIIHKLTHGNFFDYAYCGSDGARERNTEYFWRKVTCKRCKARRKRTQDIGKKDD